MIPIAPAPIACTLSAASFKERAQWLHELTARALLSHRIEGQRLHLSYRPDARADVEKMVQRERQCCGFLKYELQSGTESIEVVVSAPTEACDDAQASFAHLIPPTTSAIT